jgi:hypothetical protein
MKLPPGFTALIELALVFALVLPLGADERAGIKGLIEWDRMELNAELSLDLSKSGLTLPSGRSRAEVFLEDEYTGLIRPVIFGLQVDSSNTVEDLVNRGELSLHEADELAAAARRIPPSLSSDLSAISGRYTLSLTGLGSVLIRHSRSQIIRGPLLPSPARAYTGIIIIADESLPIHGRRTAALPRPCLFPKIWDSGMNLVYERNMTDPEKSSAGGLVRYVSREFIMRSTPSGIDESLIPLVGENPMRIIARGVFGVEPTDPVIDSADAGIILSAEENRRLLREGRVVIVLDKSMLKTVF